MLAQMQVTMCWTHGCPIPQTISSHIFQTISVSQAKASLAEAQFSWCPVCNRGFQSLSFKHRALFVCFGINNGINYVFFQDVSVKYSVFPYRHKSSNRAQRTYQTSPEQETNQEQKEDQVFIYLYIEASILSCLPPCTCVILQSCLFINHTKYRSLWLQDNLYSQQTLYIVNLDIPKDLPSSKNQLLLQWYFVHFLLFYISLKGDQTDQPSHCNIYSSERLISCSTVSYKSDLCLHFNVQITTGRHLTKFFLPRQKNQQNWNKGLPDMIVLYQRPHHQPTIWVPFACDKTYCWLQGSL